MTFLMNTKQLIICGGLMVFSFAHSAPKQVVQEFEAIQNLIHDVESNSMTFHARLKNGRRVSCAVNVPNFEGNIAGYNCAKLDQRCYVLLSIAGNRLVGEVRTSSTVDENGAPIKSPTNETRSGNPVLGRIELGLVLEGASLSLGSDYKYEFQYIEPKPSWLERKFGASTIPYCSIKMTGPNNGEALFLGEGH